MKIRKLTEADYVSALELFYELDKLHADARPDWFVERGKEAVFPQDAFLAGVQNPECLFLGAFDPSGTMLGLVRASLWEDSGMVKGLKNVCLDDIYVRPQARRQGIASELYRAVELWAKELGAKREVNGEYAFIGDAIYSKSNAEYYIYNAQLLKEEIQVLKGLKAKFLLVSHLPGMVMNKDEVIQQLEEIYSKRSKSSSEIFVKKA